MCDRTTGRNCPLWPGAAVTRGWLVSQQDVLVRNVAMPLNTNWENSGGAERREEIGLGRRTSNWAKYEPSKVLARDSLETGSISTDYEVASHVVGLPPGLPDTSALHLGTSS